MMNAQGIKVRNRPSQNKEHYIILHHLKSPHVIVTIQLRRLAKRRVPSIVWPLAAILVAVRCAVAVCVSIVSVVAVFLRLVSDGLIP